MIRIHGLKRISAENLRMKSIIFAQREEKFLIKLFYFCFFGHMCFCLLELLFKSY